MKPNTIASSLGCALLMLICGCASVSRDTSTVPITVKDSSGEIMATSPREVKAAGTALATKEEVVLTEPTPDTTKEARDVHAIAVEELKTVYFDTDQYELDTNAKEALGNLAAWLRENPAEVKIDGFADKPGSPAYNLELSKKRALSVKSFLEREAGDSARVSVLSHGENPGTERKAVIQTTRQ